MPKKRSRLVRILRVRYRRALAGLDRDSPWMRTIPSWGSSVLLHAVAIVLLAVVAYTRSGKDGPRAIEGVFSTQLAEDLTSLKDSDHAGDPFTTLQTPEPPSLTIEPAEADLQGHQPARAPLAGPFRARAGRARDAPRPEPVEGGDEGPATALRGHDRPLLGEAGVDPRPARPPRRGDGPLGEGGRGGDRLVDPPSEGRRRLEPELSGPVPGLGLPARDRASSRTPPPRGSPCSRCSGPGTSTPPPAVIATWCSGASTGCSSTRGRPGTSSSEEARNTHMYSHAIATMALCEAYGISRDPRLREPAQKAIDFIVRSQHVRDGGWRYAPGQAGDTSVFGWQMFALRSARLAGLSVSKNALKGCRVYLDLASTDPHKATYAYQPGRPGTPVMTAEALLCRQYLGWPRDSPAAQQGGGAGRGAPEAVGGEEYLLLVLRDAVAPQHAEQGLAALECQGARRPGRHAGDGDRLRPRQLGSAPPDPRPLGTHGGAALPDLALAADPRGVLPLPAALSPQRHRPDRPGRRGRSAARRARRRRRWCGRAGLETTSAEG